MSCRRLAKIGAKIGATPTHSGKAEDWWAEDWGHTNTFRHQQIPTTLRE